MPDWKLWREMAEGSLRSADRLIEIESSKFYRSAISRYYYAAFQAVTSFLLFTGLTPADDQEGWAHTSTSKLLFEHSKSKIGQSTARTLALSLHDLYSLRLYADYKSAVLSASDQDKVKNAAKKSKFIIRVIFGILQKRNHP